jgi:small-conductance mechanosensitive channel
MTTLRGVGFYLSVIIGTTGILTATTGVASQASVSNLINGIFRTEENSFKWGGNIKVSEITGEVVSIDWLSVKIRQFDNLYVRVPNKLLINNDFKTCSIFQFAV